MMSAMRLASCELVEIFTTGATGLPVGVPRPVVKSTRFAPAPACAVTHSTSLPGVQSRFRPDVVAYCGKSSTSRTGATPPLRAAPGSQHPDRDDAAIGFLSPKARRKGQVSGLPYGSEGLRG